MQWNLHYNLSLNESDRKIVQNYPRYEHLNFIFDAGLLEETECHVEEVVVLCRSTRVPLLSEILKRAIIHYPFGHNELFRKLLRVFVKQFFSVSQTPVNKSGKVLGKISRVVLELLVPDNDPVYCLSIGLKLEDYRTKLIKIKSMKNLHLLTNSLL